MPDALPARTLRARRKPEPGCTPGEDLQRGSGRSRRQPEGNERLGAHGGVVLLARTSSPGGVVRLALHAETFIRTGIRSVNRPWLLRAEPAVHQDVVAGHERGLVGADVQRERGDLVGLAPAAHRGLFHQGLVLRGIGAQRGRQVGRDEAGADGDARDLVVDEFQRERLREAGDGVLRRRVDAAARARHVRHDRREVDDPAVAVTLHHRDDVLAREPDTGDVGVGQGAPLLHREVDDVLADKALRRVKPDILKLVSVSLSFFESTVTYSPSYLTIAPNPTPTQQ